MRWRPVVAALTVATAIATTGAAGTAMGATGHSSAAANASVALHGSHGIVVKSVKRIGTRQLLATIAPKALEPKSITVRILLPVGYRADAEPRYPVLYLFPGTSGHSYDWMTAGHAPETTKHLRLITVSSDIGFDGDGFLLRAYERD